MTNKSTIHVIRHTCEGCGGSAECIPDGLRNTFPTGWGYAEVYACDDQGYVSRGRKRKLCDTCLHAVDKAMGEALKVPA